jgi:hypothetical protein
MFLAVIQLFIDYSQPFSAQHKVVIVNVVDEVSPSILHRLTCLGPTPIPKVRWERIGTPYHGGHRGHHRTRGGVSTRLPTFSIVDEDALPTSVPKSRIPWIPQLGLLSMQGVCGKGFSDQCT